MCERAAREWEGANPGWEARCVLDKRGPMPRTYGDDDTPPTEKQAPKAGAGKSAQR